MDYPPAPPPPDDPPPSYPPPGPPAPDYPPSQEIGPVTAPIVIRSHDPLAAALGNASLLGVGYLLLRRRWRAVLTLLVSVTLVVLLATVARSVWFELVVLAWWLLLIADGWFLASRRAVRVTLRRQRVVAAAFTVPVLLVFGLLRWHAGSIEGDVTDARAAGDCPQALAALDRVWLGDRVADAPMTVRGEATTEACDRLSSAGRALADGLANGATESIDTGFYRLGRVLADLPGHEHMVDTVLDEFLHGLPTKDPCRTTVIDDWLRERDATHDRLDRAADIVPRTAPEALLGCGDQLMVASNWDTAREHYQQLIKQYPDDSRVPKANAGIRKATLAIERDTVTTRVADGSYCSNPAKYSAAPAYGRGGNKVLFLGQSDYANRLPAGWRTTDPAHAALVACLGSIDNGPAVQTCAYRDRDSGIVGNTTFHKIDIPVRGYSVRTGKLVVNTTIRISGSACPMVYFDRGFGVPPHKYVTPSTGNIRSAFRFLALR